MDAAEDDAVQRLPKAPDAQAFCPSFPVGESFLRVQFVTVRVIVAAVSVLILCRVRFYRADWATAPL